MKTIRASITGLLLFGLANLSIGQEQPRKPMSPVGVAATQVGGKWSEIGRAHV